VDTSQIQRRPVHADLGAFPGQDLLQMVHLLLLYYPAVVLTR